MRVFPRYMNYTQGVWEAPPLHTEYLVPLASFFVPTLLKILFVRASYLVETLFRVHFFTALLADRNPKESYT